MSESPSIQIRPVREDDIDAMLALAAGAGPGFTNLPIRRPQS